jgi:hypothetical protein
MYIFETKEDEERAEHVVGSDYSRVNIHYI